MKNILLGMAGASVVGIVFLFLRRKDEVKLMDEKIMQLQNHFQSLDRVA
jgi:hypothetical protein